MNEEKDRARQIIGNVNNYAEDDGGLSISAFGPLSDRIATALTTARREAREEALREASNLVHAMSRIEARGKSFDFLSGAAWVQNKAALLLAQRGVEAAASPASTQEDAEQVSEP